MRRYFLRTLAVAALAAAAVAAFLYAIDPFAILRDRKGGVYRVDRYLRIAKPHWAAGDWDTVVVGSSVSLRGIQPQAMHRRLPGTRRAFNFGIDGVTAYELRRHAQHVMTVAPVRRLLLEARPFMLGGLNMPPQFSEARLAVAANGAPQPSWRRADLQRALFSGSALHRGLELLLPGRDIRVYRSNGAAEFREDGTYRGLLAGVEKFSRRRILTTPAHIGDLRRVLDLACAKHVSVDVFLPPVHALALEALYRRNPTRFDEAKRDIAGAVFAAAKDCRGGANIALWDFMIFSRLATEPVLAPDRPTKHFTDATHFRRAIGERLLRTMATGKSSDIGVLLTPARLEPHLRRQRGARATWLETKPSGLPPARR